MKKTIKLISEETKNLETNDLIDYLNSLREYLHSISPFKDEPVDFVRWEKSENVIANEYNPNKVAPPEMELLEISIINDGYNTTSQRGFIQMLGRIRKIGTDEEIKNRQKNNKPFSSGVFFN